jgi:hypothetical protein
MAISLIAKRESISLLLEGMKLPKLRRAVFFLFQVRISPPFRPPPNKTVSSFMTASAGPRVFPPSVTELEIDFDEKVSEIESSAKSAALADGVEAKQSAETRMIRRIMNKSYSYSK